MSVGSGEATNSKHEREGRSIAKAVETAAHKNIEQFHLEKFHERHSTIILTHAMSAPSNVSGDLVWEIVRKF